MNKKRDFITISNDDYALIDSGNLEKLEKFGDFLIARSEPQALWPKNNDAVWSKAVANFSSKNGWKFSGNLTKNIEFSIAGIKSEIEIGKGKNLGIFPEYAEVWKLFEKLCQKKNIKVLNLFAYTGMSSIACAKGGAGVVHVDASRVSNTFAKKLADKNKVGDKIRFITDDCLTFLKREGRRGNKYDLIILDPPVFGRGAKGEVFKLEEQIIPLLKNAKALLSNTPVGVFLGGYASEYEELSYANILDVVVGGQIFYGSLGIKEQQGRLDLPLGKWAFSCFSDTIKGIINE